MRRKTGKETRCRETGGEEVRKTDIAMEGLLYLERVGGEWRTTATDRRSWGVGREQSERKVRKE